MIIECKNRDEWLSTRRQNMVTASDVAAILGFSPRGETAYDVYAKKKAGVEIDDNDAMLLGRCLEPGIADVYAAKTERRVEYPGPFAIFTHPDFPWLGSSLDRQTWRAENDVGPLEIKHAGRTKYSEWADGVPLWVEMQIQTQIQCSEAQWGAYCGIVGGQSIILGDVDRNQSWFESVIPELELFHWRLRKNHPPEVISPKNLDSVKRLYSIDSGNTVSLGDEYLMLVNQWEEAKNNAKLHDSNADLIEAKLRDIMKDSTFGILNDGTVLTLKTTNKKGYTAVHQPVSYRTLRRTK